MNNDKMSLEEFIEQESKTQNGRTGILYNLVLGMLNRCMIPEGDIETRSDVCYNVYIKEAGRAVSDALVEAGAVNAKGEYIK